MNPSSQGAVGALAFIPQKTFAVHSQSSGFSVPDQCNTMASTGIVFFPSPYDVFSFNVVPSMFVWIGK